MYLDQGQR